MISGPQDTGAQGWDTLVNIENVWARHFSDTLTGDNGDNWLWGSPATLGNGSISSLNNDFLYGMGGNDLLVVGIGNHTIDGGGDNDTLRFTENGSPEGPVIINLQLQGQAQDTGQGSWINNEHQNSSGGTANDSRRRPRRRTFSPATAAMIPSTVGAATTFSMATVGSPRMPIT